MNVIDRDFIEETRELKPYSQSQKGTYEDISGALLRTLGGQARKVYFPSKSPITYVATTEQWSKSRFLKKKHYREGKFLLFVRLRFTMYMCERYE